MSSEVKVIWEQIRRLPPEGMSELIGAFFDDPELREDMLDIATLKRALAEEGERVELEDFLKSEGL